MLIERKPLGVKAEAFVHLQRRHPLRNIPIDGKRQAEEIIHLFFVLKVKLEDVHGMAQKFMLRHIAFARCAICPRRSAVSLSIVKSAPR